MTLILLKKRRAILCASAMDERFGGVSPRARLIPILIQMNDLFEEVVIPFGRLPNAAFGAQPPFGPGIVRRQRSSPESPCILVS
jgi:hypothetical protein